MNVFISMVKLSWTMFHENNQVHGTHILIGKRFLVLIFQIVILSHDHVSSVAAAPFPGECVPDFLNLNVDNGAIFHGCNNICNDKAAIFNNLAAFAWKNLLNVYWLVKND